jgi:hypothetical protein
MLGCTFVPLPYTGSSTLQVIFRPVIGQQKFPFDSL